MSCARATWARWWRRWARRRWARWIALDEILELKERYGFRVHVDAAYGGYFTLIAEALEEPARRAYAAMEQADSIVIDPHKHGLQPYGCGCVLFRDPAVGRFYKHDSPYTYFTSKELHLHPSEYKSLPLAPGTWARSAWSARARERRRWRCGRRKGCCR